jgi:hypothetical protein
MLQALGSIGRSRGERRRELICVEKYDTGSLPNVQKSTPDRL